MVLVILNKGTWTAVRPLLESRNLFFHNKCDSVLSIFWLSTITDRVICLLYFKCNKWIKKKLWKYVAAQTNFFNSLLGIWGIHISGVFVLSQRGKLPNTLQNARLKKVLKRACPITWLPIWLTMKGSKITSAPFSCCSHCNRPYLILYYTQKTKHILQKEFTALVSDRTVSWNSFVNFIDF